MPDRNKQFKKAMELLLYSLTKQFRSGPLDIYTLNSETVSKTGVVTLDRSLTEVKRAILLPEQSVVAIVQTISKIGADKQFVFGGQYDRDKRVFIIDGKKVPSGFELGTEDWFVFEGQKYQVASFWNYYDGCAYLVMGQEQPADTFSQIHAVDVYDTFTIEETAVDT